MSMDVSDGPLKIDLHAILRKRIGGWKGRLIPGFMITGLEKVVCQDGLNALLEEAYPRRGAAFSAEILRQLGIDVELSGMENIPEEGRFVFASNHPLGGLDGITLISVLAGKYGDSNIRFLVNDMLMNVEPLRPVFLPVNKYGSQGRGAARAINDAYASDRQIIIFPAGLCSRLGDNGEVRDLKWNKSFIAKAVEYKRDIIPVHFIGENSQRFYKTARRRKKLGLRINIEQALLPSELCNARGKDFTVVFGKPIPWQSLIFAGKPQAAIAEDIKDTVYSLCDTNF